MRMSKQILGLLVALITVLPVASAQEQWGEGEVEDAVVVIEKERKITLPFASRRFEKVPPLPSATKDYNLSYTLRPIPFSSQPIQPRMRVLTIKQENLSRINGNFVKAGFGNYLTPYLDANIGNGRNAESSYGVKATHLSSG